MPDLKQKTVLVTGGTTGIGRATAIELASAGARIFTFGRHKPELDDALNDIRAYDPDARGMIADAAKPKDVDAVMNAFDKAHDQLDVLIANAGISGDALADAEEDDWRYVLETNVAGYLAFAHAAAERMRERKSGHIVLIGSISADSRGKDSSLYVATKAAIQGFAESFAKELAESNVRVSLVEPGLVGTDMQGPPGPQRPKIRKHEMLKAEDIAEVVHFMLARPERVNMQSVRVVPRLQD